jgi:hypothetical protein
VVFLVSVGRDGKKKKTTELDNVFGKTAWKGNSAAFKVFAEEGLAATAIKAALALAIPTIDLQKCLVKFHGRHSR